MCAFTIGKALKVKDFPDGLSKTVFFSERNKGSLRIVANEPPTSDDLIKKGSVGFTDPVADANNMLSACGTYTPVKDSNDSSSAGRWDKGDTTGSGNGVASYTDGWPTGTYCHDVCHVAPPIGKGKIADP